MDIVLPFPHAHNANVECNAPLSRVKYRLERSAPEFEYDAESLAHMEQSKADARELARQEHEEEFQRKLLQRLKKASIGRKGAHRNAAAVQAEQLARIRISHPIPVSMPSTSIDEGSASTSVTPSEMASGMAAPSDVPVQSLHPPAALSHLQLVCQRIEEKSAAARELLLLHTNDTMHESGSPPQYQGDGETEGTTPSKPPEGSGETTWRWPGDMVVGEPSPRPM